MKKTFLCLASMAYLFVTPVSAKQHDTHDNTVQQCPHHKKCSCPHHAQNTQKNTDKPSAITVSKAFIRPTASANMSSAAYLTLKNTTNLDDTLIKIESDIASLIEIHNTKIDDKGVMSMTAITTGITIPTGKSVQFEPRGLHIMLLNIAKPLVKETVIPLRFTFEKSGTKTINFYVADNVNNIQCKHHCNKQCKH